jgi:hypothetical protein
LNRGFVTAESSQTIFAINWDALRDGAKQEDCCGATLSLGKSEGRKENRLKDKQLRNCPDSELSWAFFIAHFPLTNLNE